MRLRNFANLEHLGSAEPFVDRSPHASNHTRIERSSSPRTVQRVPRASARACSLLAFYFEVTDTVGEVPALFAASNALATSE
jgi:hypothetical protein